MAFTIRPKDPSTTDTIKTIIKFIWENLKRLPTKASLIRLPTDHIEVCQVQRTSNYTKELLFTATGLIGAPDRVHNALLFQETTRQEPNFMAVISRLSKYTFIVSREIDNPEHEIIPYWQPGLNGTGTFFFIDETYFCGDIIWVEPDSRHYSWPGAGHGFPHRKRGAISFIRLFYRVKVK